MSPRTTPLGQLDAAVRVAVVTGAASGIGAATALRLATDGASVVLVDIDATGLASTTASIRAEATVDADGLTPVACDVSRQEDWSAVIAAVDDLGGTIDLLHSNASTQRAAPAHELDVVEWQRQLAVNLTASFVGFRACLPYFRRPGAAVVLTSSVHALTGMPGHPAYAASKGGLLALTRQLAVEYGPDIRVNCVVPGPVLTPAWDGVGPVDRRRSAAQTALGRLGDASEVAAAVAFLASDQASFITGTQLVVDGGWSIKKESA